MSMVGQSAPLLPIIPIIESKGLYMSSNKEILSKKRLAEQTKEKRQEKIMIVLGIAMAVLVAVLAVCWMIYNLRMAQIRKLSDAEMRSLFEDDEALPEKDDTIVGTWFFYVGNDVKSKYVLTPEGRLKVYTREKNDFVLTQLADYRVREKAKTIYVKPDVTGSIIPYEYDITLQVDGDQRAYIMVWINGERGWSMIKVPD